MASKITEKAIQKAENTCVTIKEKFRNFNNFRRYTGRTVPTAPV
ncbi:MAG TPA: hypothetical protein VLB84_06485 [Bacteroidia bacterium]|nr:hypothetical protein [Bacteroidia bacterium]